MRIDDVRRKINNSFLYKRFAYRQSEGFIALIRFLESENRRYLVDALEVNKKINLYGFLYLSKYSFSFTDSRKGFDFWYKKIFKNKNFKKIENTLL